MKHQVIIIALKVFDVLNYCTQVLRSIINGARSVIFLALPGQGPLCHT